MKKVDFSRQVHWFSPYNVPALCIDSGETVLFTCKDTWNDTMTDTNCIQARDMLGHPINPCNGPVYVNDAMPGDTLKITIENVRTTSEATLIINDNQVCKGLQPFVTDEEVVKFPIKDGVADLFGNKVKLKPFPGCLGVAPNEKMSTLAQGRFGGNMDCKELVKGTVLYLPVFVPGGLVVTGDIHAYQGDGEIIGGLEVSGEVQLKLEVIKGVCEEWPILETPEKWFSIVSCKTLERAGMESVTAIMKFVLKRSSKYTPHQLMLLLAELGDSQVCQMVDTLMTMRYGFEKRIIEDLKF